MFHVRSNRRCGIGNHNICTYVNINQSREKEKGREREMGDIDVCRLQCEENKHHQTPRVGESKMQSVTHN